jgi:hypothetical protein
MFMICDAFSGAMNKRMMNLHHQQASFLIVEADGYRHKNEEDMRFGH